jgi:membrane protein implicated in regulation of membrane protease activity
MASLFNVDAHCTAFPFEITTRIRVADGLVPVGPPFIMRKSPSKRHISTRSVGSSHQSDPLLWSPVLNVFMKYVVSCAPVTSYAAATVGWPDSTRTSGMLATIAEHATAAVFPLPFSALKLGSAVCTGVASASVLTGATLSGAVPAVLAGAGLVKGRSALHAVNTPASATKLTKRRMLNCMIRIVQAGRARALSGSQTSLCRPSCCRDPLAPAHDWYSND